MFSWSFEAPSFHAHRILISQIKHIQNFTKTLSETSKQNTVHVLGLTLYYRLESLNGKVNPVFLVDLNAGQDPNSGKNLLEVAG